MARPKSRIGELLSSMTNHEGLHVVKLTVLFMYVTSKNFRRRLEILNA